MCACVMKYTPEVERSRRYFQSVKASNGDTGGLEG